MSQEKCYSVTKCDAFLIWLWTTSRSAALLEVLIFILHNRRVTPDHVNTSHVKTAAQKLMLRILYPVKAYLNDFFC